MSRIPLTPDEAKEIMRKIQYRDELTEREEYQSRIYRTLGEIARLLDMKTATLRRAAIEGRLEARQSRKGGWWRCRLTDVAEAMYRGYKSTYGETRGGMTAPKARWRWRYR